MKKAKVSNAVNFVKNIRRIYRSWKYEQQRLEKAQELDRRLTNMGFEWQIGSPSSDIGTALELAREYEVELQRGTCYGDCVAAIARENWRYPIRDGIKSGCFGGWFEDNPHDQIQAIYAYDIKVRLAICRCLIFARTAGVI